jgi:hypothetical protein
MGLPEGEGGALTLTARGVWLVQIPLAKIQKRQDQRPATTDVAFQKSLFVPTMTSAEE